MRLGSTNLPGLTPKLILMLLVGVTLAACDAPPPTRAVPPFAPRATSVPLPPAAKGSIVKVTRGDLSRSVSARGSVASARQSFLFFNISGTISKINVATGDQIKQGASIAQLDAFLLQQDVDLAKLNVDKADLELREAQVRIASWDLRVELVTKAYARANDLAAATSRDYQAVASLGLGHPNALAAYDRYQRAEVVANETASELNRLKTEKQVAALDVDIAQRRLQYYQKTLEALQTRLNGANLTAPLSGLVISVDKQVGDSVQAFEPIGAIADPSQLQIEANIPDADMLSVSQGQPARVVLDGFPDRSFNGKVKEIASKASIFQGKNVYRVLVTFDDSAQVPATLRMGADVLLARQAKESVLLVPSKAIQQEGGLEFVTVLHADKWERIEVQVGANGGDQTEILSGLSEGDQILVP